MWYVSSRKSRMEDVPLDDIQDKEVSGYKDLPCGQILRGFIYKCLAVRFH